jgi:hypothetical protein
MSKQMTNVKTQNEGVTTDSVPAAGSVDRMITCFDCKSFHAHLNNYTWWCAISKDADNPYTKNHESRIDQAKKTQACNYAHDKIKQRLIDEGKL